METPLADPDQWCEEFESASLEKKHEIITETVNQPLSQDFIEDSGLIDCLFDMFGILRSKNLITEALSLIGALQTKQPEFYKSNFQYFDDVPVIYYLYRDDREKVVESLSRFMEDPLHDLDMIMPILSHLRLYGYTDVTLLFCQKAYKPVEESPEYMPGAENDLGIIVFLDLADRTYRRIRDGETVDWELFTKEVEEYGYNGGGKTTDEVRQNLTGEMEGGETFIRNFRSDREKTLNTLTWAFLKYMLDQKNMDFVCSEHIMNGVLGFLRERKLPNKSNVHPYVYFKFPKEQFSIHLGRMIGGFLSTRQAEAVGTLWGIVYVYDFLLSKNIIVESIYRNVMESVNSLKADSVRLFRRRLWAYDFAHRWTPPDSISEDEFATESSMFAKTLDMKIPIGEEVGKPGDFLRQFEKTELPSYLKAPERSQKRPSAKKKKGSGKSRAKKKRKKRR